VGPPERGAEPPLAQIASTLAFGAAALSLFLAAYRASTPAPPPPETALVLADPASPSIAWRPARVPRPLALAALAGVAALVLLAASGLMRAR
jgi:hypothetical protein